MNLIRLFTLIYACEGDISLYFIVETPESAAPVVERNGLKGSTLQTTLNLNPPHNYY